jgi:sec-independent protein translocase protein TatC
MDDKAEVVAEFYEKYLPYFLEFRKHLFIILGLFILGALIGLLYSQQIFNFIVHLYNFKGVTLITTTPYQYIDLTIAIGFLSGLLVSIPYAFMRFYYFFKPALKKSEQKLIRKFAPLSLFLFIAGFSFGMWIMQMIITYFSATWSGSSINSYWDVQHFFSQIIMMSLLTGLIFQIPVLVTVLIKLHIIKRQFLVSKRRHVYVILLILAVLMPPTDIISLILLTLPLLFLFELGLLLNKH